MLEQYVLGQHLYRSLLANSTANLRCLEQRGTRNSATRLEQQHAYLGETVPTVFLNPLGSSIERLEAWQSLCWTIGDPLPRPGEDAEETELF